MKKILAARKPAEAKQTAGAQSAEGTPEPGRSKHTRAAVDPSETQEAGKSRSAGSRHRTAAASRGAKQSIPDKNPGNQQEPKYGKRTKARQKIQETQEACKSCCAGSRRGTAAASKEKEQHSISPRDRETSRNPNTGRSHQRTKARRKPRMKQAPTSHAKKAGTQKSAGPIAHNGPPQTQEKATPQGQEAEWANCAQKQLPQTQKAVTTKAPRETQQDAKHSGPIAANERPRTPTAETTSGVQEMDTAPRALPRREQEWRRAATKASPMAREHKRD